MVSASQKLDQALSSQPQLGMRAQNALSKWERFPPSTRSNANSIYRDVAIPLI